MGKGKKIISQIVDSDDDPEVEQLKDQLEVSKSQLTMLALKEFQERKKQLLDTIKDRDRREEVDELIQSGEDLSRVEATMKIIQSGLNYGFEKGIKSSPRGQAKLESYPTSK